MWLWKIKRSLGHLRSVGRRAFRSQINGSYKDKCLNEADKPPKPRDIFKSHTTPGKDKFYMFLTIVIGLPIIFAGSGALFLFQEEKEREPFVPYSYMRIRNKKFPWGNGERSFFHNPKYNALPDGYEDEEEE